MLFLLYLQSPNLVSYQEFNTLKKPISILLKRIKASFDELKVNIKAKNFFV